MSDFKQIQSFLGDKAASLLEHQSKTVSKDQLHLPSPTFVDDNWALSDRSPRVLRSLQALFSTGRLANTGYLSILPVDQGIEHSAGASFAKNPAYFDSENIVKLAVEGGCNGVASTFGVLASVARKYAHRIPFIVKVNHNELLTYPNKADQIMFGQVEQAWNMGAVAISTLAGTMLLAATSHSAVLLELTPFIKGLTLLFWATATWWIPMLVILGAWRHLYRRFPLRYDPLYWGAVFPMGMYTACTFRLTQVMEVSALLFIPRVFVYIALAAWALTLLGLLRHLMVRGAPAASSLRRRLVTCVSMVRSRPS